MTREEIIDFINASQYCFLATVENGEPRVRGMAHYKADENGIIFHTGGFKDVSKQLKIVPKAEMCVFEPNSGIQVRVRGNVEFLEEKTIKQEIIENRPFLKPIVEATGFDAFVVFRLRDCEATVWTMTSNQEKSTYIKL